MARLRDRELSWDYTDDSGHDFFNHASSRRRLQRLAQNDNVPLQRDEVQNLLCSLHTSSRYLQLMLDNIDSNSMDASPSVADILHNNNADLSTLRGRIRALWINRRATVKRIFSKFLQFHLLITVVIQIVNISVISLLDSIHLKKTDPDERYLDMSATILITLQVLCLIIILVATGYLTHQIIMHQVSSWFLAQIYFATILVFAGLYTVTYRLNRASWKDIGEHIVNDPVMIIDLYMRMLYLSVSTATLCGASALSPKIWYNYIFISAQMLISFGYFAQILARSYDSLKNVRRPIMYNVESQQHSVVDDQSSIASVASYDRNNQDGDVHLLDS